MPRKRRPVPPAPGSLPLRKIAAQLNTGKPPEQKKLVKQNPSSKRVLDRVPSQKSLCVIPNCLLKDCNLKSHRHHTHRNSSCTTPGHLKQLSAGRIQLENVQSLKIRNQLTPTIELPIKTYDRLRSSDLFCKFFTNDLDQICAIYGSIINTKLKNATFHRALKDPLHCLAIIAQAHLDCIKSQRDISRDDDQLTTSRMYLPLLQKTRETIQKLDVTNLESVLLAIVTLCEYDLKHFRYDAMRSHRSGLTTISLQKGGVHYLGRAMPYVLHADRVLAICLKDKPWLISQPHMDHEYVAFDQDLVGADVSSFSKCNSFSISTVQKLCIDSANFLRLMDTFGINLNQDERLSNVNYERFYFLREQIEIRQCIASSSVELHSPSAYFDFLALTATQIMLYYICQANYIPSLTIMLGDRLWGALLKVLDLAPGEVVNFDTKIKQCGYDSSFLLWLSFVSMLPEHKFAGWTGDRRSKSHANNLCQPAAYRLALCTMKDLTSTESDLFGAKSKDLTATCLEDWMWPAKRLEHEFEHIMSLLQNKALETHTHEEKTSSICTGILPNIHLNVHCVCENQS